MKIGMVKVLYLYLATLLGLLLLAIGSINLLSLGLRTYVFTQADREYISNFRELPVAPVERMEQLSTDADSGAELTDAERHLLRQAIMRYKEQQKEQESVDPLTARRHRELSTSLSMILVGLPLYLYHWGLIRKDKKHV